MEWQLVLVLVAVAISATYLVRAGIRSWRRSQAGCGGGCGCSGKGTMAKTEENPDLIPIEDLKLRRNG